jgi:hypothetical protein
MSEAARVADGRWGVKTRIPEFDHGRKSTTFASRPAFMSRTT